MKAVNINQLETREEGSSNGVWLVAAAARYHPPPAPSRL